MIAGRPTGTGPSPAAPPQALDPLAPAAAILLAEAEQRYRLREVVCEERARGTPWLSIARRLLVLLGGTATVEARRRLGERLRKRCQCSGERPGARPPSGTRRPRVIVEEFPGGTRVR